MWPEPVYTWSQNTYSDPRSWLRIRMDNFQNLTETSFFKVKFMIKFAYIDYRLVYPKIWAKLWKKPYLAMLKNPSKSSWIRICWINFKVASGCCHGNQILKTKLALTSVTCKKNLRFITVTLLMLKEQQLLM